MQDIVWVIQRRFDPNGRDRALAELARAGCAREIWKPILLWHLTRDEFLVRDFLVHWLFPRFANGTPQLRTEAVVPYLENLPKKGVIASAKWSSATLERAAQGLLRMAVDFGLMKGTLRRSFVAYHLPDESFLYLLHAMHEQEPNAGRMIDALDWRMYLMTPRDVERRLFDLHQFRKLEYDVAGTLAQLTLPASSALEFARSLVR